MNLCPTCNQPIKESILEGRKLIAQVHTGPYTMPHTGRYVTVILRKCACGERIERRYENLPKVARQTSIANR
jgi:hypothetical protein